MAEPPPTPPERDRLRERYHTARGRLLELLAQVDPIGLVLDESSDEYAPEVGTILPRLVHCACELDVLDVVYGEFVAWFGADVAGSRRRYALAAERVWVEVVPLLQPHGTSNGGATA